MKFQIADELKFIKLKFIGLFVTFFVLVTCIIFSFGAMTPPKYNHQESKPVSVTHTASENKILTVNELLFNRFTGLQKMQNDHALLNDAETSKSDSEPKEVAEAEEAFKKTLDSIEINKTSFGDTRNQANITHIIASYRLLLVKETAKPVKTVAALPANMNDRQMQQMKSDLQTKDSKIAQLQNQVKSLQNNSSKTNVPSDYDELVARNKYLDFDVRSVVKSNLELTKENSALKRTTQELNSQIRELKKSSQR